MEFKLSTKQGRAAQDSNRLNTIGQVAISFASVLFLLSTLWFAFFAGQSNVSLPPDHANTTLNDRMYMAAKLTLTNADGKPASRAIVTANGQQIQADENGVAWLADVMHHSYDVAVVYEGQHFTVPVHFHTPEQYSQLGMSIETKTLGLNLSLWGFGLLLGLGLLYRFGLQFVQAQRNFRQALRTPHLKYRALSGATLGIMGAGLLLVPFSFGTGLTPALAAGINESLPVPSQLKVTEDDRVALLTWNGGTLKPGEEEDPGVTGYLVSWGMEGQPLGNTKLTQERVAQLQPLENGKKYLVQVQSVDSYGQVSKPSQQTTFTGNSARVDAMRSKLNGFFDDFNLPAGGYDELKWNSAYSHCTVPENSSFFINTQFHAHNLVGAHNCDRGQSISRPRQEFDFTNRTGTIMFDFDGEFRRDQWYLDIVPEFMDITGQVNLEAGENAHGHPGDYIRIHQNEQNLKIIYVDKKGTEQVLAVTDYEPYPPMDALGMKLVSNVRREWTIHFSQNSAEVLIDGVKVLATDKFNLNYSKAYLLWNEFSYNTLKSNEPFVLVHWDNFGFDAPAGFKPATETHNYRVNNSGADFGLVDKDNALKRVINIPDSLAGAKSSRFMFTMQMDGNQTYSYNPDDHVLINGKKFSIPKPKSNISGLTLEEMVSSYNPYSTVIDIPVDTLKTGKNEIEFHMESSGVLNIHTEVDFAAGKAPAYTQPGKLESLPAIPAMRDIGPGVSISKVGGKDVEIAGTPDENKDKAISVSGKVNVLIKAAGDIPLQATGTNPGISKLELFLNKKPIWVQATAASTPAPAANFTVELDTTQLTNGKHELFARAANPSGSFSFSDYFQGATWENEYFPVIIQVNNAVAKPSNQITTVAGAADYVAPAPKTAFPSSQLGGATPAAIADTTETTAAVNTPVATTVAAGGKPVVGGQPDVVVKPKSEDSNLTIPLVAAGGVLILAGAILLVRATTKGNKAKAKKK